MRLHDTSASWRRLAHRWLWLALFAVAGAHAQDVDPTGRVGRLSDAEGRVWVYAPDAGEWVAAARNQPVVAGDRVATEAGARAELQVGSTTIRLDGPGELDMVRLDDDRLALVLHDGSAWVRLRDPAASGRIELQTDEGRFTMLRAGTYRVDRRAGRSDLTVIAGRAQYDGPNSGIAIEPGQHAQFFIDAAGVAQYSLLAPVADAFAAWSEDRDRRSAGATAERWVSPEMTGVAQLDAYGRWEQDLEQGALWIPTAVAADWAPYAVGRWVYARPWGWTWVDDAPWGFAPFHYGRWAYLRGRWCWAPGQRVARPVYAPALVAWVGASVRGPSFAGGPPVGWVPLAPREVYVPGYRVSARYARELNLPNVGNPVLIDRVFANPQQPRDFGNRSAPRGLTFVPPEVLTERRPVAPVAAQWRDAPWAREVAGQRAGWIGAGAPPVAAPRVVARDAEPSPARSFVPSSTGREPGRESGRDPGRPGFGRDVAPPAFGTGAERPGVGGNAVGTVGQPPVPGGVGQPPFGREAGQPPFGRGTGQPPFGRDAGSPNLREIGPPPAGRFTPPVVPTAPPTPVLPAAPITPRPTIGTTAPPPEGQTMRTFPIRREGGDDPRRGDERRPGFEPRETNRGEPFDDRGRGRHFENTPPAAVRPAMPPPPAAPAMQALPVERAPIARPAEIAPPVVAPAAVPRIVEPPRMAPPAPRIEGPRGQREEPRGGRDEPRRPEPGAAQR